MTGPFVSSGPAVNAMQAGLPVEWPQELVPGGRLTGTQGTAVTTSDVLTAANIFYEPRIHNRFPCFDGTRMQLVKFPASSVSLPFTCTSGKVRDVFGGWDGSRVRLALGSEWTDGTTRADALTTLAGVVDGFAVNSVAVGPFGPRRATWLGIVRASAADQYEHSDVKRFLCNAHNVEEFKLRTCPSYVNDDTVKSQSFASAADYIEVNGGTGSKVEFLTLRSRLCRADLFITATVLVNQQLRAGISLDSTTGLDLGAPTVALSATVTGTSILLSNSCFREESLSEGYHFWDLLAATNTATACTIFWALQRWTSAADPMTTVLGGKVWG